MNYQNMFSAAFNTGTTYVLGNKIWFDGMVWACIATTTSGLTPYQEPLKWVSQIYSEINTVMESTTLFVFPGFLNSSTTQIDLYAGQSFTAGQLTYYTPTNTVYTCVTNAAAGENPVSNPSKWTAYPGGNKVFNQFYALDVTDFLIPANSANTHNIRYQRQRITVSNGFIYAGDNKCYRVQVWERVISQETGYSPVYGIWVQISGQPTMASYNSILA